MDPGFELGVPVPGDDNVVEILQDDAREALALVEGGRHEGDVDKTLAELGDREVARLRADLEFDAGVLKTERLDEVEQEFI